MARNQIREKEEAMKPLYEGDEIQATMNVLEMIDNEDTHEIR